MWNETVGKETEAWSRGLRENPPSTEFRVVRPDRMYFADGKPAFSQRAVDRVAEKNRERERRLSAETGKPPMGEMSHEEKQEFMDTLRQTARTPLEKLDAEYIAPVLDHGQDIYEAMRPDKNDGGTRWSKRMAFTTLRDIMST